MLGPIDLTHPARTDSRQDAVVADHEPLPAALSELLRLEMGEQPVRDELAEQLDGTRFGGRLGTVGCDSFQAGRIHEAAPADQVKEIGNRRGSRHANRGTGAIRHDRPVLAARQT